MSRADYAVTVTLERPAFEDDLAGGVIETWAAVATGLRPTLHYHRAFKGDLMRSEDGPGVVTRTTPFFTFREPFPDVQVNDRIVVSGGLTYAVQFVRRYARTLQADVEVLT